jgi:DNA-binding NtrC family response regulator
MKLVTSAIDANSAGKVGTKSPAPMGNISDDAKSFPRHVLVVDDESLIRWSVAETLSDLGCDVEQATDAAGAIRAVMGAARDFDVVVLDLRLPDMHDLSLLGTLRHLLPSAALILMTAFGTPDIISGAQELGATVLQKPFELDALKRLVREPETETN